MKLLHIADLHIGRNVCGFDMIDDQSYILKEILKIAISEQVTAILIAGDIYDKSIPSTQAVELLDSFLTVLSEKKIKAYIISGNHDGKERLSFGNKLMQDNGVFIYSNFDGTVHKFVENDLFGKVNIYLLPFIRPEYVKPYFQTVSVDTFDAAVGAVLSATEVDKRERNILLAHQFVTNDKILPERCESEQITVGGLDNVDFLKFDAFDYVALGHIHSAQHIGRSTVRYAGTPLKYSTSEIKQIKSVTLIGIEQKGTVTVDKIPLTPKREMRTIRGTLSELTEKATISFEDKDYIYAILTDEDEIYDAAGKLRSVYPNLLNINFDNKKTAYEAALGDAESISEKKPLELFAEFYQAQNGIELTDEKLRAVEKAFEEGAVKE